MIYTIDTVGDIRQISKNGKAMDAEQIVSELNYMVEKLATVKGVRQQAFALIDDLKQRMEGDL